MDSEGEDNRSVYYQLQVAKEIVVKKDKTIGELHKKLADDKSEHEEMEVKLQQLISDFKQKEKHMKIKLETLEERAIKSAENYERTEIERLEKEQELKKINEKMEELKKQFASATKKVKELETSEALTNWKIISSETTIEGLKAIEHSLNEQLNEIRMTLNAKELKITTNIHVQDEITEEMNSYRARYDKQQKELQDCKKEVQRYKNNYQMASQSLSRLNTKYDSLEQKYIESKKVDVFTALTKQNEELCITIEK